MNLFNKLPTLSKISLFQRNVGREYLRKVVAVSPKYGSVFYSKPAVYSDVGKDVKPSGKDLNVTNEHNYKIQRPSVTEEFKIEDLKKEDVPEAIELISKNYSSLNPLRSMLHISYQDQMEMLHEVIPLLVGNKVSVVIRDLRTKKIVATCFPRIHPRPDKAAIEANFSKNKNIRIKNCNRILNSLRNSVNLYEKYNVDKVMEPSLTAIDQKYSGTGLLNAISQEIRRRAEEHEYRVLIGVPTHAVTQALCKTRGGILEFEIDIESVKIDGKQVLDLERKSGISSFQLYSFHL